MREIEAALFIINGWKENIVFQHTRCSKDKRGGACGQMLYPCLACDMDYVGQWLELARTENIKKDDELARLEKRINAYESVMDQTSMEEAIYRLENNK